MPTCGLLFIGLGLAGEVASEQSQFVKLKLILFLAAENGLYRWRLAASCTRPSRRGLRRLREEQSVFLTAFGAPAESETDSFFFSGSDQIFSTFIFIGHRTRLFPFLLTSYIGPQFWALLQSDGNYNPTVPFIAHCTWFTTRPGSGFPVRTKGSFRELEHLFGQGCDRGSRP